METNQQEIASIYQKYRQKNKKPYLSPYDIITIRDQVLDLINIDEKFRLKYIQQHDLNNIEQITETSSEFLCLLIQMIIKDYQKHVEKEKLDEQNLENNREQNEGGLLKDYETHGAQQVKTDEKGNILKILDENGKELENKLTEKGKDGSVDVQSLNKLPEVSPNARHYDSNHRNLKKYLVRYKRHIRDAFSSYVLAPDVRRQQEGIAQDQSEPIGAASRQIIYKHDCFAFLRQAFENDNFLILEHEHATVDFFSKSSSIQYLTELIYRFYVEVRCFNVDEMNVRTLSFDDILDLIEFWLRVDEQMYIQYQKILEAPINYKQESSKLFSSNYVNSDQYSSQEAQNDSSFQKRVLDPNQSFNANQHNQSNYQNNNESLRINVDDQIRNYPTENNGFNNRRQGNHNDMASPQISNNNLLRKQKLLFSLRETIRNYEDMLKVCEDPVQKKVLISTLDSLKNQSANLLNSLNDDTQEENRKEPNGFESSRQRQMSEYGNTSYSKPSQIIQKTAYEKRRQNLKEIFLFYSKQHYTNTGKATFDRIQHENNMLTISKFMQYCQDFLILEHQRDLPRSQIIEIFKKSSNFFQEMNFEGFLASQDQIADCMFTTTDTGHQSSQIELLFRFLDIDDPYQYRKKLGSSILPFSIQDKDVTSGGGGITQGAGGSSGHGEQTAASVDSIKYKFKIQGHSGKTRDEVILELEKRKEQKSLEKKQTITSDKPLTKLTDRDNSLRVHKTITSKNDSSGKFSFKPEGYSQMNLLKNRAINSKERKITWNQLENITFKDLAVQIGQDDVGFQPEDLFEENQEEDNIYLQQYQNNPKQKSEQLDNQLDKYEQYGIIKDLKNPVLPNVRTVRVSSNYTQSDKETAQFNPRDFNVVENNQLNHQFNSMNGSLISPYSNNIQPINNYNSNNAIAQKSSQNDLNNLTKERSSNTENGNNSNNNYNFSFKGNHNSSLPSVQQPVNYYQNGGIQNQPYNNYNNYQYLGNENNNYYFNNPKANFAVSSTQQTPVHGKEGSQGKDSMNYHKLSETSKRILNEKQSNPQAKTDISQNQEENLYYLNTREDESPPKQNNMTSINSYNNNYNNNPNVNQQNEIDYGYSVVRGNLDSYQENGNLYQNQRVHSPNDVSFQTKERVQKVENYEQLRQKDIINQIANSENKRLISGLNVVNQK